jgi:hypothetical protein
LSRPGLRPSSPRALPAPIVRRRSEAFDLPIAHRARYVRLDRERSGRQPGSMPMRLRRTRPLGSVVPGPVVVVRPVVPGALVPIMRIVAGLRRATAIAATVDAMRGRSGSAGRGRAGARRTSGGGRPPACVRGVRSSSVVRSGSGGERRDEDRGGYRGRHGRRSTMRPARCDRVRDPGEGERGCNSDREGPARPLTAQGEDGSRDVHLCKERRPPRLGSRHRDSRRGARQTVVDLEDGPRGRPVHGEQSFPGELLPSPGSEITIQLGAHVRSSSTSARALSARHCFALIAPGVVPMAAATSSLVKPTRYFNSIT